MAVTAAVGGVSPKSYLVGCRRIQSFHCDILTAAVFSVKRTDFDSESSNSAEVAFYFVLILLYILHCMIWLDFSIKL